jgi:hypothetical protein
MALDRRDRREVLERGAQAARGENWPIGSCTATVMTVSTSVISLTIAVTIVLMSFSAAVGVPVTPPADQGCSRILIAPSCFFWKIS